MGAPKRFTLSVDGWGRWVADPKAFLVVAPFWLVFSLLGVPNIGTPRVLLVAVASNALALSVCFGLLMFFRHTVFAHRNHRRVSVVLVVAVGTLIGTAKAVTTVWLIALGLPDPDYVASLPSRILGAASTGAWLLPVSALFLATRARFLSEREQLLQELSSATVIRDNPQGLGAVATTVRDFADRTLSELGKPRTPAELRRYLRKVFQPQLRKITQQLVTDPATLMEGSSFRDLVAATIRSRSYPLAGVALVHIVLTGPFVFFQLGLAETLGRAVVSTGLLVFALWVLKKLPIGGFTTGLALLISLLAMWIVVNELIAFVIFGPFGDIPLWLTAFANFTVALSHTVLLGAMRIAADQQKSIRSHLDTLVTEKYWQRDIETLHSLRQRRALAQHLHGRIQSVLLATLTRLKKNPESADCQELISELDDLSRLLGNAESAPAITAVTLGDGLQELSRRWGGILTIDWITPRVSGPLAPEDIRAIIDVTEESASNAVRHGMATEITITVATSPSHITVTASDNGIGPRLGAPGVGSFLYSNLPGSQWSLTESADPSGATLKIGWNASPSATT